MISKRLHIYILGSLLLVITAALVLFKSNALAFDNPLIIRSRMRLAEIAKPSIIWHSETVTPTTIIQHPKPKLVVDDKILRDLDCPLETWGGRYCVDSRDQGQSQSQGCFAIYTPDNLLGGLQPAYPIAACSVGDGKYVYQDGCMITMGTAYILERQGKYERVDSFSVLKSIYAPIESENEALSYAIAATGYSALYGTETFKNTEYFVGELENTHVEARGDEYIVRLYDYDLCGCGQHETIAIDVAVNRQGNIREIYREEVYRDAYSSCID